MYHKHHTRGIVLWGRDDGVDSRRISIFTEDFGLISTKVQGARNLNSKLRSGAQDYTLGQFSIIRGKSGWKFVSVRPELNIFEDLKHSGGKLRAVVNVLNLLKKLAPEEQSSPIIYDIVKKFLDFVIDAPEDLVILAECLVLIRILNNLGYLREDLNLKQILQNSEITPKIVLSLSPIKQKIIDLINESLKATHLT